VVGREALTALAAEAQALSAVLRDLGGSDLARPTNCPPWDLAELVVHIGMSIRVDGPPPAATSGGALVPAAGYYRRPERDTPPYRLANVDRTVAVAAAVLRTASAAQWFDHVRASTVATLSRLDPGQVVHISGVGPMSLADWTATRVMSLAAHGLDVAITLGRPPWTTRSALRQTTPMLVALLGMPAPAELGWDDRALLAAGTGRRPLTEAERGILGPAQLRFPLLS
jgi:uncharacterized protein (TIGR03083 family)